MSEEQIRQQQANQIAEILNSIKNCKNCPIYNTCNDYEYVCEAYIHQFAFYD